MAAKARRADKGVLSRQDIAARRRQIAEKKLQTGGTGRRAIVGVFALAFSLLALLAVATFDPHDRTGPGYRNAIGPMGHLFGEGLRGLFGICAYVIPLAGLWASAALLLGRARRRWPQWVSLVLLTLSGSVLAQLAFGGDQGWAHPPGGGVGEVLGELLAGLFSTVGTIILVSAVCIAALIVGTQFVFLKLCAAGWAFASEAAKRLQVVAAAFWAKQKESMAERAEARAKAKEEEAQFLAQLEADEEELLAQEREVAEAEAIAEEADRLEREAMKKREEEAAAKRRAKEEKKGGSTAVLPIAQPSKVAPAAQQPKVVTAPAAAAKGEPAWVSALLPANNDVLSDDAVAETLSAESTTATAAPKRGRKTPNIVTADAAPAPAAAASSATADVASSAPAAAAAATVAAASTAPATAAAAIAPAASAALARMPLIVEPKAPPKPTAALAKKKEPDFQMLGGRTQFTLPPTDFLDANQKERSALDKEAFLTTAEKLRAKLADFGIVGEVVEIRPGPVVTMYEFLPGPGIKVSKIASLQDDLAMAMEAMRVRIVAPIPGKGVVGIEVPNKDREMVFLKEIAEQDAFTKSASRVTMCVGKDIEGMPYVLDLAKAPHLLIAGTTGSGKSVAVNAMIMSILLKSTPEEVRFIMVDPKMLELSVYEGIPHLLLPVVTDPKKAALALRWAVEEMERRYALLAEAGVRNIAGYNKLVETAQGELKRVTPKPATQTIEARAERIAAQKRADSPTRETGAEPAPSAESVPSSPAASASASASASGKKPRKMMIIDVAAGESEEEALERIASGGPSIGVPTPHESAEDVREAVVGEEPAPMMADPLSGNELKAETEDQQAEPALAPSSVEAAEEKKDELKKLPYIVVIIDELADLMMVASREVETYIARLAQMARAAGIHLMVATQRPSTDVVTGVIKANFPTRVSFMLRSKPDSMTILGTVGAEALLGMGDMLIMPPTSAHLQRVHGAYVSEQEIHKVVEHLKAQGKPVYDENILKPREEESEGGAEEDDLSDELYDQALATVAEMKQVSISMLQRKMRIGYNRAARMIERMERDGVVGPADGARPREVLIRQLGEMPGAGAA